MGDRKNVTIDGLWITHAGAHGVNSSTGNSLKVKNCVFSWIGGSVLGSEMTSGAYNTVRYGNAVQVYGSCDGFTVENNWIYQIYDTGVTHQYNLDKDCTQNNVLFRNNLIEYCYMAIEFYNFGSNGGGRHITKNVNILENYCRFTGFGWGSESRPTQDAMIQDLYLCPEVSNFKMSNNIFYRHNSYMMFAQELEGSGKIVFSGNIFAGEKGSTFGRIAKKIYAFDDNVKATVISLLKDKNVKIVYLQDAE